MEAMWMRFSPLVQQLREHASQGRFGEIRSIDIQAGYATSLSRLADADPGRGALMNFGVYAVSLVQMLLGTPEEVHARFIHLPNKLDELCTLSLRYPNALATITASIRVNMSNDAVITGTRARGSPGAAILHTWLCRIEPLCRTGGQRTTGVSGHAHSENRDDRQDTADWAGAGRILDVFAQAQGQALDAPSRSEWPQERSAGSDAMCTTRQNQKARSCHTRTHSPLCRSSTRHVHRFRTESITLTNWVSTARTAYDLTLTRFQLSQGKGSTGFKSGLQRSRIVVALRELQRFDQFNHMHGKIGG